MPIRRRSYADRSRSQGPALPGLEDCLEPTPTPRRDHAGESFPSSTAPTAIPAETALALFKAGHAELCGLLALCTLRAAGRSWRISQRQAAKELGSPLRTLRRHERTLQDLGLLEVEGRGSERSLRVIHKVLHKLPTPATGGRLNRPQVAASGEDNGMRAREESELKKTVTVNSEVRAHVRARSPGLDERTEVALSELASVSGLWGNVLPEARELARRIAGAWGSEAFVRYTQKLLAHVALREPRSRGGLVLGSMRARAAQVGGGS